MEEIEGSDGQDRRARLLAAGVAIFSQTRYDDVAVSDIADHAGVAHGLLFHHFGTKRAFYLAVVEEANRAAQERFAANTVTDPARWFKRELDQFLRSIAQESQIFLMLMHGVAGAEPETRAIVEGARNAAARRIIDKLAPARSTPLLEMAVLAWVESANQLGEQWISNPIVPRARIPRILTQMLTATLEGVAAQDKTAGFDPRAFVL